jgi:formate-dependent nitrite reductase membrane component NrfD
VTASELVPWWQVAGALALTLVIGTFGGLCLLWLLRCVTTHAARREHARRSRGVR